MLEFLVQLQRETRGVALSAVLYPTLIYIRLVPHIDSHFGLNVFSFSWAVCCCFHHSGSINGSACCRNFARPWRICSIGRPVASKQPLSIRMFICCWLPQTPPLAVLSPKSKAPLPLGTPALSVSEANCWLAAWLTVTDNYQGRNLSAILRVERCPLRFNPLVSLRLVIGCSTNQS